MTTDNNDFNYGVGFEKGRKAQFRYQFQTKGCKKMNKVPVNNLHGKRFN